MELYIRVKDGKPFEHPIVAENFKQAFPDVDVNNLPPQFARFTRVKIPSAIELPIGPYEVPKCSYVLIDGVYTDVWGKLQLTDVEKTEKQLVTKASWVSSKRGKSFPSWIFNIETCQFEPPVSMPIDGKQYYWSEKKVAWQEITPVVTLP